MRLPIAIAIVVTLAAGAVGSTAAETWRHFVNVEQGYRIDLPTAFTATEANGRLRLIDRTHDAQIEIYSGRNPDGLSVNEFVGRASEAEGIADVTYRTGGRTWFVLSGHYTRDTASAERLIYYAKFVFSPDLTRFVAFETSYPVSAKRWMDPIVVGLERSLQIVP